MKSSKPKNARVNARIPATLKNRLIHAEQLSGIAESDLLNLALEALCRYVERSNMLSTPFEIVPRNELRPAVAKRISTAAKN
ncbi:MAG: hypothetical protein LBD30_00700 [Verrucomicrobiales bacterium]|jgi:hypothetical protein|nr:hypothetical protein [Verrucomicrobiales bacterium]